MSNRVLQIRDAQVIRALAIGSGTDYLGPFVGRVSSIAEAAASLSAPISRIHYWVSKWHSFGILTVAEEVARKGRSIKRYTCVADEFVIAPEDLPHDLMEMQLAEIHRLVSRSLCAGAIERAKGAPLRIYRAEGTNDMWKDYARSWNDPAGHQQSVSRAVLTLEQVAELKHDIQAVRAKCLAMQVDQTEGERYVVTLGVVPEPED